jgi:hypothetical protein
VPAFDRLDRPVPDAVQEIHEFELLGLELEVGRGPLRARLIVGLKFDFPDAPREGFEHGLAGLDRQPLDAAEVQLLEQFD